MARKVLNNLEAFGIQRGKINDNFSELYSVKLESSQVLTKTNTTPYTPTTPYHPATKQYADGISAALVATYDPTGQAVDAFDRTNHFGQMPAANVDQDADHRFVSDVEKVTWNNKEDSIGAKKTAFNKNFGVLSGQVAEGDHTHAGIYEPSNANIQNHIATVTGNPHAVTLADVGGEPANANIQAHIADTDNPHATTKTHVGLGNADNTPDADKPISSATQAALDLKVANNGNVDSLIFTEQTAEPYAEGKLYYDAETKTHVLLNDIEGTALNVGEETRGRVINKTGSILADGMAVRFDGYDAASGLPKVALAQADTFSNALVAGFTTVEIPINGVGMVVNFGLVRGLDLSLFDEGVEIFLSDVDPGGLVTTLPDIVTRLGGVFSNDNEDGSLFANITNNVAFPVIFGQLDQVAATFALTTSYQNIDGWTTEDNVVMSTDDVTGYITTPNDGKYRVTVNLTCNGFASAAQAREVTVQLWDVTNSHEEVVSTISIAKDADSFSRSFSKMFDAVAGNEYVLRILASIAIADVDFTDAGYDIESVHIR